VPERNYHCFSPRPLFMASALRRRGVGRVRFPFGFFSVTIFLCPFVCGFLGAHFILGQAQAEGKGELATSRRARTAGRKRTVHTPRHDLST